MKRPSWAKRGNCYVTCEALYHLLGGKKSGWRPATVRHEGDVHWFLRRALPCPVCNRTGVRTCGEFWEIMDPTASQFREPPRYELGRGRGFLTRRPSKRAAEMMQRMVWQ